MGMMRAKAAQLVLDHADEPPPHDAVLRIVDGPAKRAFGLGRTLHTAE
jgi:hypothetical protein